MINNSLLRLQMKIFSPNYNYLCIYYLLSLNTNFEAKFNCAGFYSIIYKLYNDS